MLSRYWPVGVSVFAALLFWQTSERIGRVAPAKVPPQLYVALPATAQVALAGGDRYLAANLAVVRAVVASTDNLDAPSAKVLGQIQRDAAELNPFHEDNYYLAAAVLPWIGQVDAAQYVLQQATNARQNDALPPFFLGFNEQYFNHNYTKAADAVQIAADRSSGTSKLALSAMAARWLTKGGNPDEAISALQAIRDRARDPGFRAFVEEKIARMADLRVLRNAAHTYVLKSGRQPKAMEDILPLVVTADLSPQFSVSGYKLDEQGKPVLNAGVVK